MGLDQITVELHECMGSDKTWKMLVDNLDKVDFNLEYNELSHIRFRFHFHVPIFVSRQYMRHRNQSPNEMSGRYRTMPSEFLLMPDDVVEIYNKALDVEGQKQRSKEFLSSALPPMDIAQEWEKKHEEIYRWYKGQLDLLKNQEKEGLITNSEYKRAREVLRGILGTSFFTDIVATWDLNNLLKFFKLRLDPHAQIEIQDMAQKMLEEIKIIGNIPEVLNYFNL